jgi:subtilisin family serine protease
MTMPRHVSAPVLPALLVPFALALGACIAEQEDASEGELGDIALQTSSQYVVVLQDGADAPAAAAAAAADLGVRVLHVYDSALRGFSFRGPAAAAVALARNPVVDFVQPDAPVEAAAQTLPTGIDRIDADLNPVSRIDGIDDRVAVNVGVIDTGIDLTHPDLDVAGGTDCIGAGSFDDDNGHGTHVSGTIGALDNADGVVGVAPGVRLFAAKVLNASGSGSISSVVCGVDFVTRTRRDNDPSNDIAVANMSLTAQLVSDPACARRMNDALHKAVCGSVDAGVVHVVAAGNSSSDASGFAPASYDEVLTVSAYADFDGKPGRTRSNGTIIGPDTFAGFSNRGADVDIGAPGVSILSTFAGGTLQTLSGTSMATPHVTGAVALFVSQQGLAQDAAGVAAVRAAITRVGGGFAVAQSDARGFAEDPDLFPEPALYIGPP